MDSKEEKTQSLSSGISGVVKSIDDIILSNARVSCDGMETKTLADGTFTISNLKPGTHNITIKLQGYNTLTQSVPIKEEETTKLNFILSTSIGSAKIYGSIYDSESKMTVKNGGSMILVKPINNEYGQIDHEGRFEFKNLAPGNYRLFTSISEYETRCATFELNKGEIKKQDFILKMMNIEEPPWG